MLSICFKCCDCVTRLRPAQTAEQSLDEYKRGDTELHGQMNEALETFGELEEAGTMDRFKPSSNVDKFKDHGLMIYQDFGVLDEKEFFRLTDGLTPKQCGKKPVPFHLGLSGQKGKQNYYLVHLRGLDIGEIMSMRKCRLYFNDSARYSRNYLNAKDQVLLEQGTYVFDFCYDMVFGGNKKNSKDESARPELSKEVESIEDIMRKAGYAKTLVLVQKFC